MTIVMATATFPGSFPTLAVDGGRIYLGTGGFTNSPWEFRVLDGQLGVLVQFSGGVSPAGAPQRFGPNDFRWLEMAPDSAGKWPEWKLSFNGLQPVMEPTGISRMGSSPQPPEFRDGHALSALPGAIAWDERTITGDVGGAHIAGNYLCYSDNSNTKLTRYGPNGHSDVHSVPEGIYSFAVAPDGLVWYQPVNGTIKGWTLGGTTFDMGGDLPTWVQHAANWSCDYESVPEDDHEPQRFANVLVSTGWHPPTGVYTFISSDSHNGCLMLNRPSEPFARVLQLDDKHVVVATYNSLTQPVTTVLDVIDLTQPFQEDIPEPGIDPPVDPPDGGDMTQEQYLALVAKVNEAVDAARAAERLAAEAASEARTATNAAMLAVAKVTDAPVRMPYLGTGRLNPK